MEVESSDEDGYEGMSPSDTEHQRSLTCICMGRKRRRGRPTRACAARPASDVAVMKPAPTGGAVACSARYASRPRAEPLKRAQSTFKTLSCARENRSGDRVGATCAARRNGS
ncbi:hypothetical protein EVAR_5851_1 [Eumeta japonica]|uniref:Uncharacterized protein n=1 Tax=Eumeta variegata TaxID=151549 RepID=A0A4C1TCS7_EUMVA|nr:hypothetical protein EVAR_5851_1 [Eumeta japonica]